MEFEKPEVSHDAAISWPYRCNDDPQDRPKDRPDSTDTPPKACDSRIHGLALESEVSINLTCCAHVLAWPSNPSE